MTGGSESGDGELDVGAYSIRIVASQTGIPADTLRVWERRYGFPAPRRRSGGGRLYDDATLTRLKLIARARTANYRPGDLMGLSNDEILRLLPHASHGEGSSDASRRASEAIWATRTITSTDATRPDLDRILEMLGREELDAVRVTLRSLAIALGPRSFIVDVAAPLAIRVGALWQAGALEIHHEHMITSLLSIQIRLLLAAFEEGAQRPVIMLTTLPNEAHALGLELVALYLATHRAAPLLVGPNMPPESIARAAAGLGADVVGISVSRARGLATRKDILALVEALAGVRKRPKLWVGGAGVDGLLRDGEVAEVRVTTSWERVDAALDEVRAEG